MLQKPQPDLPVSSGLTVSRDAPIRRYDLDSAVGRAICSMVLGDPSVTPNETLISKFTASLKERGLQASLIVGCTSNNDKVLGVIGVESPGRLVLLFLPQDGVIQKTPLLWTDILRHAVIEAGRCEVKIVQALVEPPDIWRAKALQQAGFEQLATLMYMERAISMAASPARPGMAEPQFRPLSEVGTGVLGSALAATYAGSLDCPGLNDRRSLEEILAAHRSAGEYDPGLWFVADVNLQPAGVILLAPLPGTSTVELVYMGVVPEFRGQGVGDALLRHARRMCHARQYTALTLAVDAANAHAIKLYERWRFKSVGRRIAWVAFPNQTETAR